MPYITEEERKELGIVIAGKIDNPGKLNYIFTVILNDYIQENGLSYQKINDVVGALEGAKAEFQRRIVVPYENTKLSLNGDVYGKPKKV